jgi:murein L,D-transpeptidase YcbB/YkuD
MPFLDEKLPFIDNIHKIDGEGYSITDNIPYLAESYDNDVINGDMIYYSIEQQRELKEWLDENKPERFVLVDLSSYKMYLVLSLYDSVKAKDLFIEMETPIVVGNKYHKTPSNSMNIISLKYNPTWTPTLNIMKRNAKKDGGEWNWDWIESHGFDVYSHETGEQITWEEADDMLLEEIFMVSPPSEGNALGKLKFETDSKQSIYFHDTNEKSFFQQANRARSSGCVRVKNPYAFAAKLAYKSEEYIENNISKGETYWEKVENIPVYFYYDIIEYKVDGEDIASITDDPYGYYNNYLKEQHQDYVMK